MDNQNRENFRLSRTLGRRKNLAVDAYTLNADLNRTMVETVLADLDLALTLAEIASTSENVDTRNRNRANAREAFLAIQDKMLPRCSPGESERLTIYRKLRDLQTRLKQLGENLQPALSFPNERRRTIRFTLPL